MKNYLLRSVPYAYLSFMALFFLALSAFLVSIEQRVVGVLFFLMAAHFTFRFLRYKPGTPVLVEDREDEEN